jgi:hypothetical protein
MDMNNTIIYICTHKDFIPAVHNDEVYKIIDSRSITPHIRLKDDFWSELYQYKFISEQSDLPEYVGFCHYRRYFSFGDKVPSLSKDMAIAATPMTFILTVEQQYDQCHNIDDLHQVGDILKELYPQYQATWNKFLRGHTFYPCNMFLMSRDKFKEYIKFIFDIMNEFLDQVGDVKKHIEENKEKYLKPFYPNNDPQYQYRIGGYICERLTNVFLMKNFRHIETYNMIVTERKY